MCSLWLVLFDIRPKTVKASFWSSRLQAASHWAVCRCSAYPTSSLIAPWEIKNKTRLRTRFQNLIPNSAVCLVLSKQNQHGSDFQSCEALLFCHERCLKSGDQVSIGWSNITSVCVHVMTQVGMFYLLVSVFLCADNTFISGHQSRWREEEEDTVGGGASGRKRRLTLQDEDVFPRWGNRNGCRPTGFCEAHSAPW